MPQLQLIVGHDDGTTTEEAFDLESNLADLDAIDDAVEHFKNQMLPTQEHQLLHKTQERLAAQEKKRAGTANGSDRVTVRTRQGAFVFRRQRFCDGTGTNATLLPAVLSFWLPRRIVDWATRFAFSEVALLLAEECGSALLWEDSVWRVVEQHAPQRDTEPKRLMDAVQQSQEQWIGVRQKNRGLSWTKGGSRALALLRVAKLNARCAAQA